MPSDSFEKLSFRRHHLLSALRSDRIQVLVGEDKKEFQIPRDLLAKCSPVFNTMCNSSFKESIEGVIELPEVTPLTFGSFMVWLHSCPPAIPEDDHVWVVINLAIFADTYQIHPLKNQTSDLIQKCLLKKTVTPSSMTRIYESTPDGSILRELFSTAFVAISQTRSRLAPEVLSEWENVFEEFPTFGRDYFRHNQQPQRGQSILSRTGTCYFHDHGNITGFDKDSAKRSSACPYPDGGDWIENERELENKRKREQEEPLRPENKRRKTQQEVEGPFDVIVID